MTSRKGTSSPVGLNTAISSTGSSTAPTQCGRQVLNAVMSPARRTTSRSSRTRRSRPSSTSSQTCPSWLPGTGSRRPAGRTSLYARRSSGRSLPSASQTLPSRAGRGSTAAGPPRSSGSPVSSAAARAASRLRPRPRAPDSSRLTVDRRDDGAPAARPRPRGGAARRPVHAAGRTAADDGLPARVLRRLLPGARPSRGGDRATTLPGLLANRLIDGAGHWVHRERPDEVNAALLDLVLATR